jgi:hypothetical protein
MHTYSFISCRVLEQAVICNGGFRISMLILLSLPITGRAAVFTIDENLSSIRIVDGTSSTDSTRIGSSIFVGAQSSDASGDSLETNLSGTLTASISGSTLTFSGTSLIDALPHRLAPFLPPVALTGSGALEDNFGGEALLSGIFPQGDLALRDLLATITTGSVTLGNPGTNLLFSVSQGILDYNLLLLTDPSFADLAISLDSTLNSSPDPVTGSVDGTINLPFFINIPFSPPDEPAAADSQLVLEGLIVATRTGGVPGDFNNDNRVDAADLGQWQGDFSLTAGSDADADGDSDGRDFLLWQENFGFGVVPLTSANIAIPEPATLVLMVGVFFSMILHQQRLRPPMSIQVVSCPGSR